MLVALLVVGLMFDLRRRLLGGEKVATVNGLTKYRPGRGKPRSKVIHRNHKTLSGFSCQAHRRLRPSPALCGNLLCPWVLSPLPRIVSFMAEMARITLVPSESRSQRNGNFYLGFLPHCRVVAKFFNENSRQLEVSGALIDLKQ